MLFDKARNYAVSTLIKDKSTSVFFGKVLRAGSFVVDGATRFVFTIEKDGGETAVFTTAADQAYFHKLLQAQANSEKLLTVLLTYASLVKAGDRVDVMALCEPESRIIHFIEPEPISDEMVREMDRT